ncbi:efflux RND transporter periplasmic adaptor subunit [Cytophagaceae bacterium YF14B1]|uniref:Efflux RND transporter periplasmic adaptor subunit n=1 Tax=Xanthocytophaga flava TaxID=3048013 RepID=A0AAE3QKG6_9BACT|nr:efflux RND transporter periplasmic adaptor subunit [Xanthocytophaga flavus]MDJ1481027.1 efflux RND transporter periplasmic adaptor subunit [Xanthocytophaga flavus]
MYIYSFALFLTRITKVASLFLLLCIFSCSTKTEPASEETPSTDSTDEDVVFLTNLQYQTAGIQLGSITMRNISGTLKVNGMLDVPPQNLVSISPPMGGFLKSTPLLQGMQVKKGQAIAVIENLDFIQLQQEYLDTKSQLEFQEAEYQRQQELSKENVNALKTLQQTKAQYQSTLARFKGLQAKLRFIHLNPENVGKGSIQSTISLHSPINGFVTQVHGNLGAYINATDVLFKIVDPEHLHAELTIFEKDIPSIKIGQKVRFVLANETKERTATVYLIRKEIAEDRSIGVHCHLDQEDDNLFPGTYLSGWLETSALAVPTLPEESVILSGEKKYIFILKKRTQEGVYFERKEIQTGNTELSYSEIKSMTSADSPNAIVVKGAYDLWAAMTNTEEEE